MRKPDSWHMQSISTDQSVYSCSLVAVKRAIDHCVNAPVQNTMSYGCKNDNFQIADCDTFS